MQVPVTHFWISAGGTFLSVPPAFALTAFPHHLCVLYSFLKLFYTSHWNSLSIVTSYPYILNLFTEFYILVIYTSVKLEKKSMFYSHFFLLKLKSQNPFFKHSHSQTLGT